ncbi:MAG: hypothetical protein ACM3UU_06700 [Ignavibacteriales bacterium]
MANKLYDINQVKDAVTPSKPLLIIKEQTVWEASNEEDAVSIVMGEQYLMLNDKEKWKERVQRARMEVLMGIGRNQNLQVMHSKLGVIKLNYANKQSEDLEELKEKEKINIMIDNDKVFLLSFVKIGALVILENTNSRIFQKEVQNDSPSNKFIVLHEAYDIDELIKANL